jgi:hypothetical protein
VHRAAEYESADRRGKSGTEAAVAHVDVTEAKQGRPPLNRDWRDKNIKPEGGMEGAKRRERG